MRIKIIISSRELLISTTKNGTVKRTVLRLSSTSLNLEMNLSQAWNRISVSPKPFYQRAIIRTPRAIIQNPWRFSVSSWSGNFRKLKKTSSYKFFSFKQSWTIRPNTWTRWTNSSKRLKIQSWLILLSVWTMHTHSTSKIWLSGKSMRTSKERACWWFRKSTSTFTRKNKTYPQSRTYLTGRPYQLLKSCKSRSSTTASSQMRLRRSVKSASAWDRPYRRRE